jgi:ABC-type sugar transport system substrate-binding protein
MCHRRATAMRCWTRRFTVVAAVTTTAALAAGAAWSSGGASNERVRVGFVLPYGANPAVHAVGEGVKQQAKRLGIEVTLVDANFDVNKMVSAIDTLVQDGVDAIGLWPLSDQAAAPAFARAKAAGIKLIGVNGNSSAYDIAFNNNDYASARNAALSVARKIGKPCGNVAIVMGFPGVYSLNNRNRGLVAGALAAGCKIVDRQISKNDQVDARKIVDGWKTKYGETLNGILCYNDETASSATSAFDSGFHPFVNGINATDPGINGVKRGQILETWDIRPVEMGNAVAWAADQLVAKKQHPPRTVTVQMTRVTKANLASFRTVKTRLKSAVNVRIGHKDGRPILVTTVG